MLSLLRMLVVWRRRYMRWRHVMMWTMLQNATTVTGVQTVPTSVAVRTAGVTKLSAAGRAMILAGPVQTAVRTSMSVWKRRITVATTRAVVTWTARSAAPVSRGISASSTAVSVSKRLALSFTPASSSPLATWLSVNSTVDCQLHIHVSYSTSRPSALWWRYWSVAGRASGL